MTSPASRRAGSSLAPVAARSTSIRRFLPRMSACKGNQMAVSARPGLKFCLQPRQGAATHRERPFAARGRRNAQGHGRDAGRGARNPSTWVGRRASPKTCARCTTAKRMPHWSTAAPARARQRSCIEEGIPVAPVLVPVVPPGEVNCIASARSAAERRSGAPGAQPDRAPDS